MTEPLASTAPGYDPAATDLHWWRRSLAQGAGYMLPSTAFLAIPIVLTATGAPARLPSVIAGSLAVLVLFLGSSLVMHWRPGARWTWLAGLIAAIGALAVAADTPTLVSYFAPYMTMVATMLLPWREARPMVIVVALAAVGVALTQADTFAIIMSVMAFALAWSIGIAMEQAGMRERLLRAEQRTAVLAVAAERERIGRDLHDILGHSLTTIAIKADLIERLIGRDDGAARAEVGTLGEVARQALADVRATASGMREVRLAAEVASARSVLQAAGVECRTPSALPVLDDARAELFGYVVREAVTNVVRHAGATTCTITADEASVTITDDGRGIPADTRHTGLRGLAERVEAAGGALTLESSPAGTTVRATVLTPTAHTGADAATPATRRNS
ncbi:sensor histidine kinase [Propioniciclava coleopterorum]|uniref:Sensor histidine kinase n=1 Tax=Propioniciclava coleopterorum TaxID=2714937 RepID=A0A6G7Y6Q8_9ACTN|nr:sensor histidine kinase [Propioniciclava coleopterorum]QIK72399.1 sensor histidine kinase [Propioniciclava coleopterorum]